MRADESAPIRVLIVDDDALVRAGLTLMLKGAPGLRIVGTAADGGEVESAVAEHAPDVVLMDIRMTGLDGIEATRRLRARPEPPKVVVLTTFDADELVFRALRSGASGFLLKDTPPEGIVDAIRKVVAGEPILSPSVTRKLIAHLMPEEESRRRTDARQVLARLTEREREVALAVGQGKPNAVIAGELHMSVGTVKGYISRISPKRTWTTASSSPSSSTTPARARDPWPPRVPACHCALNTVQVSATRKPIDS